MNCPVCESVQLTMSERQGIEIDYCPKCRGVWLDRGELDKIVERSSGGTINYDREPRADRGRPEEARYEDPRYHDSRHRGPYKKKREGFLSDLFDFD